MELEQLTLGKGSYLLLELPDNEIPAYVEQVVKKILRKGITPILAHIERCAYFRRQPEVLLRLIQAGALGQVSARALGNKKDRGFAERCIKNGLGHFIASDLHNKTGKDRRLSELAEKKYEELLEWTESFSIAVWNDAPVPPFGVCTVKQNIFGYY
jgi:protein-tyrosine phosphatase